MTTAIIGAGNIGGAVARDLVAGGESVVLAAKDKANADALADELGPLARAASVEDAIADGDAVVFAVWLDTIKALIPQGAPPRAGRRRPVQSDRLDADSGRRPSTTAEEQPLVRLRRALSQPCCATPGAGTLAGRARRRRTPRTTAGGLSTPPTTTPPRRPSSVLSALPDSIL